MTRPDLYGFRITGPLTGSRNLILHDRAFYAYADLSVPGGVEHEAYLSAYHYGPEFRTHYQAHGNSTRDYDGPCGSDWLWFDIDRKDNLQEALTDTRALIGYLCHTYGVDEESVLCFFSGSKGFHVGLPLGGFAPEPGPMFHRVTRRFAEQVAVNDGVNIDTAVYDKVRAFRAPNSMHPKTGLYKRHLRIEEVQNIGVETIQKLAAEPLEFGIPSPDSCRCALELPADWNKAKTEVEAEIKAQADRRQAIANGEFIAKVNRRTIEFIREGANEGERHVRLFSAAANLAECGAPLGLCEALLTDMALDSGLQPSEVHRQILCGYEHGLGGVE